MYNDRYQNNEDTFFNYKSIVRADYNCSWTGVEAVEGTHGYFEAIVCGLHVQMQENTRYVPPHPL